MNKQTLWILVFTMLFPSGLKAQVMGNFQYRTQQTFRQPEVQQSDRRPVTNARIANNHEITITVNGLANLLATDYVAVFNVVQVAPGMVEALELMNNRIDTFKQHLQKRGTAVQAFHVDMISFVPRYDVRKERRLFSTHYNEIPDGFELQQNISVRYSNSSELSAIMIAAAAAEIYDLVKVDYFVDNIQHYIDSLREGCLDAVLAREQSMNRLGLRLDTLRKVVAEEFTTIYPPGRYFSYQAFARSSLAAALAKPRARGTEEREVTMEPVDRTVSRFYQQVHYDYYDQIHNPVIGEPLIQVSYTVTVKYFLRNDPPPPGNRYFMITPGGDLRQIDPR